MGNLELFFDDQVDCLIPIDLDGFLDGIPEPPPMENILPLANAASPSESAVPWIDHIEKVLMEEEEDGGDGRDEACESFLADLIVDSPAEGGSRSGEVMDASSCDDKVGDSEVEVVGEDKALGGRGRDPDDDEDDDSEDVGDGGSDDPLSKKKKKKKRQLRNRDAAARSRERKKVYVKELEMKSKYLESEYLTLGRMLQCVVAENQALRFSLQNGGSTYGALVTKQESAVLLLESLLLGSLLWSLGIICLFNLPLSIQPVLDVLGRIEPEPPAPRGSKIEKLRPFNFISFLTSRKCKASRTKIKPDSVAAQVIHRDLSCLPMSTQSLPLSIFSLSSV
ncbi:hypothetical protein MLD38_002184 [Melastoma candidum]|uniref:Uncharacterized protein n=1 Tax=Melastoma candidum TaxID=119954 RepID=A0ACB9SFQ8_9MYRT|nr:hypothetical protein MLD38_002184 [Melastoma candidum]